MAEWVLIENNVVSECHDLLPNVWKNHSGLHLSEDNMEFLNSLGWYKVIKQPINVDYNYQRHTGFDYIFENNQVFEVPLIENLSDEELEKSRQIIFNGFMISLRLQRDQRLKDSDYTQLSDIKELHGEELSAQWSLYRQQLRDLPSQFTEPSDINWPLKPRESPKTYPI